MQQSSRAAEKESLTASSGLQPRAVPSGRVPPKMWLYKPYISSILTIVCLLTYAAAGKHVFLYNFRRLGSADVMCSLNLLYFSWQRGGAARRV